MKSTSLCIITALLFCCANIQSRASEKDTLKTKGAGSINLNSIAELASQQTSTDSQRVANIFHWVTHHIEWDLTGVESQAKSGDKNAESILKTQKATARQYAELIKELCTLIGVKCMVIAGYDKDNSAASAKFFKPNHTWNAVLINNNWLLLDAWHGAGYVSAVFSETKKAGSAVIQSFQFKYNPACLFQHPEEVRLSRIPADPLWQLTDTVMPLAVFEKGDEDIRAFNEKYSGLQQFPITLGELYQLTEEGYIVESAERVYEFNPRFTEWKALRHLALAKKQINEIKKSADQSEAFAMQKLGNAELDSARTMIAEQKKMTRDEYTLRRAPGNAVRTDLANYKLIFGGTNNKMIALINSRTRSAENKINAMKADSDSKSERADELNPADYADIKSLTLAKAATDPEVLKLKDSLAFRQNKSLALKDEISEFKNRIAAEKETISSLPDSMQLYEKLTENAFYQEATPHNIQQSGLYDSTKMKNSAISFYKTDKLDRLQQNYFERYDTVLALYESIRKNYLYLIDAGRKNAKDIANLKKMNGQDDLSGSYHSNAVEYKDAIRGYINNNLSLLNFLKGEIQHLNSMQAIYIKQNNILDFLQKSDGLWKAEMSDMTKKEEEIDKQKNEQLTIILTDYKEELEKETAKVKKRQSTQEEQ